VKNPPLPPLTDVEAAYRTMRSVAFCKMYAPSDDEWSGIVEGMRCLLVTIRYGYGPDGEAVFARLNDE
jgi:hypothetical protein